MRSDARNLEAICRAIDAHNASCPSPAVAVAMNEFEKQRLGWDEVRGLPIWDDSSLGTGRFRIVCEADYPPAVEEREEARELVPAHVNCRCAL